jgi:hypothetical protein
LAIIFPLAAFASLRFTSEDAWRELLRALVAA